MDPRGVSVLRAGAGRPEPGHPVCPAESERDQNCDPGPGGSPAHGARLPVKTGLEGRFSPSHETTDRFW